MEFGPHEIPKDIEPLYAKRGNKILPTTDMCWVIKFMAPDEDADPQTNLEELQNVLNLAINPPRYCIEFPADNWSLFGTNRAGVWYAMARYDGHVKWNTFCRANWRAIGESVLFFLEDLHIDHRAVHMDIKAENILVDYSKHRFVVADFELMTPPDNIRLRAVTDDHYKWYYLGYGAELDQPIKTWRTDLVMLGYLLARLTWNHEYNWTAQERCWQKERKPVTEADIRELLILRDRQLQYGAASTVIEYLFKVSKMISWRLESPPPRECYAVLRDILSGRLLAARGQS